MLFKLKTQKERIEAEIKALTEDLKLIDNKINRILSPYVEGKTGTVHFEHDGLPVKATVPKRVEWNQIKLWEISERIAASGDSPDQYITIKRSVDERSYNAWPEQIQKIFNPARTVKQGKVKYEF